MECFLSRAKTTLWFAESFGLDICSITVAEKKTGLTHPLSVDEKRENTDDEIVVLMDCLLKKRDIILT